MAKNSELLRKNDQKVKCTAITNSQIFLLGVTRTRCIIVAVWFLAILSALPWTKYINVHMLSFGFENATVEETQVCGFDRPSMDYGAGILSVVSTFVFFVGPLFVFPIAYLK